MFGIPKSSIKYHKVRFWGLKGQRVTQMIMSKKATVNYS